MEKNEKKRIDDEEKHFVRILNFTFSARQKALLSRPYGLRWRHFVLLSEHSIEIH